MWGDVKQPLPLWAVVLSWIFIAAGGVALVSLVAEHGFFWSPEGLIRIHILDAIIIAVFVVKVLAGCFLAVDLATYFKQNRVDFFLLGFLGTALLVSVISSLLGVPGPLVATVSLAIGKIYLISQGVIEFTRANRKISFLPLRPAQTLVITYLVIILVGTLFLTFPRATVDGQGASLLTAGFTATSALCVTGLIVVDTGSYFSPLGQGIILVLIQIGGLGLMTFTAFFSLLVGRNLLIKEKLLLKDALNVDILGRIGQLLKGILGLTFAAEGVGAVVLFFLWGKRFDNPLDGIGFSVFHAVSAFCNAGFSLLPTSLMSDRAHWGINFVFMALIILGGLGFMVVLNLVNWLKCRALNGDGEAQPARITIHTKMAVTVSGLLLAAGAIVFFVLEGKRTLSGLPFGTRFLASLFQSVTARTAGFNTIDFSLVSPVTLFFFLVLMFIGASPGSTGGGIKTVTFGIVAANFRSLFRGRPKVEAFGKTVPEILVKQATAVFFLAVSLVTVVSFFLLLTERGEVIQILFEVFSAFGTVGLSTGITSALTDLGKVIIILTMFCGRLGPLTVVMALGQKSVRADFRYPEERVQIG